MRVIVKVSIALPAELLQIVRDAVKSGAYASTSEVVRDALRDWHVHRRATTDLAPRRTDLSKSEIHEIEMMCLRLDVLRLAVRGSTRKRRIDFAVDFAGTEPAYLDQQRNELRTRLALMFQANVRLFQFARFEDADGWLGIFPGN